MAILRWQAGLSTFTVPQAAAPIAFTLLALSLTGSAESGAVLVLAMTSAQVLCGVPVTRLGRRFRSACYLRALLVIRSGALIGLTLMAALKAPFAGLTAAVVAVGAVNGAAYAYLRALLNHLVEPGRLPRALGVAATCNEVIYALAPVLASVLGSLSPIGSMAVITALGAGPLILMPTIPEAEILPDGLMVISGQRIPAEVWIWLYCAAAGSAVVSSVEVGAVAFALNFGMDAGWAFLFATTLCLGSVSGGIWVSVRNRMPGAGTIAAFLAATAAASGALVTDAHIILSLVGAGVIGFFLPSLATFYSLRLDQLAPPGRRPEMFALQRTATSMGVIVISGLLSLLGLRAAVLGSFVLLLVAFALATLRSIPRSLSG